MTTSPFRFAAPLLALVLLAGCAHGGSDDEDSGTTTPASSVAVTTAMPVRRGFHDSVEAFGEATGDPRHARSLSLAHGGQVVAVLASAGQAVHAGTPLLRIAPDPATRQAWTQARSALALAQDELQRTGALAARHLATQSQLAAARKAVSDAQAALAAQRALGGAQATDVLAAPSDGVVTQVQVALGERFAANAPLLAFVPAGGLLAQLGVPADQASGVVAGMPVAVRAVYGDARGEGRVLVAGAAVDPQTHLVPVQVALPAALAARLTPGAALEAQIETASYTAWAVPRRAVLHDDKGGYLFQLDHGKARRVDVRLRHPGGDSVGVLGKLDAALPVIVQGAYELDDGMAVREDKP
ncbi:efflux RND transporter periplasmic adaptor subunit [Fulvimonas sp. R45]|uniref:efflux RND transporter periplasmic adaptor subunit n=1 Tax=Fulvimonas sp. R45 TaxID=3045937 RepID=UPI00265FE0E4|nr:efflux RND transporter periplasmic adaptor subunit [Fulvimonas sp. R45]MDO1528789.1 efflux RND transporter periplasmic adaptor subunit [Fulvimonas sp. R45]